MAKKGLIKGFLSEDFQKGTKSENQKSEYSDSQHFNNLDIQKFEQSNIRKSKKLVKRKSWKFKGFYISPENEIKLKELEFFFLKKGEKKDTSDIINLAIEELYRKLVH